MWIRIIRGAASGCEFEHPDCDALILIEQGMAERTTPPWEVAEKAVAPPAPEAAVMPEPEVAVPRPRRLTRRPRRSRRGTREE